MPFDITSPAIIHCGAGEFDRIAGETARLGERAVIVTGGHLHGSGRIGGLVGGLNEFGVEAFVADPITDEPTVDMVDDLAAFARKHSANVFVAIGGGSVMDTAKAAAAMATNDGQTEEYQLKKREIANSPTAQVFAPTTAGTGSESTRVSVLTNSRVGIKRSISHPLMVPDAVVLDPKLTSSCSDHLTTLTAMDAFAHAIESAVSNKSSSYTRGIALAGISELAGGLPGCQEDPNDMDARLACLLGSCLAGLSMQQGLGASHSLAPAVCIVGGMRHSEAVGALLPHAIRLNERAKPGAYDQVKRAMGCDDVAARLEAMCAAGGFSNDLAQFGLSKSDWPEVLAAMNRYASHRQTNPVEVTDDYARRLFESAVG